VTVTRHPPTTRERESGVEREREFRMERLERNLPTLRRVAKLTPKDRNRYLELCPKEVIKTLIDICLNLILGNVNVTSEERARLKRNATALREFAGKKGSLKRKRQMLVKQRGGIFPFLIPLFAALPALATAAKVAALSSGIAGTAAGIATTMRQAKGQGRR
jgi:hypothetical protein